jgi:hypothetical protein
MIPKNQPNQTKHMTIAQQLKIKDFPFIIKDKNGNQIYHENADGSWCKKEHDANGKKIYHEYSTGYWWKSERDANGNDYGKYD